MSGFNTKERNNNGEYEITFYTESRQDFEKVQDLCRELIDHNKPVSIKGDLISRSEVVKTLENIEIGKFNRVNVIETIKSISITERSQGDLISRGALRATIIEPLNVNDAYKNDWYEGYYTAKNEDVMAIDNAPTVEPERPKGEWIAIKLPITEEEGDIKIICSNCKDEFIGQNDLETWIKVYHFCPICGADMKGGAE